MTPATDHEIVTLLAIYGWGHLTINSPNRGEHWACHPTLGTFRVYPGRDSLEMLTSVLRHRQV